MPTVKKIQRKTLYILQKTQLYMILKIIKVHLFNEAEVIHSKSKLTAYYICIDFNNETLTAKGLNNEVGEYLFTPILKKMINHILLIQSSIITKQKKLKSTNY